MTDEQTCEISAREEKLVPSADRVKISATNIRIEPTVPQKEETFQVFLDIIKASQCFKAFTIIADVPEIYMQQFWFTVKNLKKTPFYEFGLDDKKFTIDVEVFMEILDICPRVPNEDFVAPPSKEDLLVFLIELGYKGLLDHLVRMFVDHMHQPWRTLATIINKSLSGKTSSNNRLHQSRVAILWGMQAKLRRREIMPCPRFTKIIINHFLSLNPSIPKGPSSGLHTIKDDGIISRLKFVRIEAYQTFIKYSTGLIPPKKSRGKGSQGKKSAVTQKPASVEVSDECDPGPTKRQTGSRRKSKKKVSISADDNIIPEPDVALEKLTRRRPFGIAFGDTSSVSQKKSPDQSQKLKGIQTMTVEEQLAADTMQALKDSKKLSRSQPHAGGSSKGTGVSPGVPDKLTVILTTSSEGNGTKPGVPNEVKGSSKAKGDSAIDWGSKEESEYSEEENVDEEIEWLTTDEEEEKKDDDEDDKSIDIEKTDDDEETDDEFVYVDEYVHDDVDKEMKDAEDVETGKDNEEITNAEKTEVTKGDLEEAGKLPLTNSSLSVSSGFGNQFLNLSFDTSLIGTIKVSADTKINSLLDIQIQQEVPHIQSPSILIVPVSMIPEPSVLSPIPKIPTVTHATTPPPPTSVSIITHVLQQTTTPIPTPPITTVAPTATTVPNPLPAIAQRVSVLEKEVQELKQVDHSEEILASIRSHQESQKSASEIIKIKLEHASKQNWPKHSSTPFDKTTKNEYKQKDILLNMMIASKSFEKHPAHKELYDALIKPLLVDEDDMDQAAAVILGQSKAFGDVSFNDVELCTKNLRGHVDNEEKACDQEKDPSSWIKPERRANEQEPRESWSSKKSSTSKDTSQGNSPPKTSKFDKSMHAEERVVEPTEEVTMDNAIENVINDVDQPQDDSKPKTDSAPKHDSFKQPLRPPTPDPYIELEYNMKECFKALSDRLDWENTEGDRCPFDLSKPLPLKGHPGTDIAKISRKRSKPDNHGHGKGKENTRAGRMLSKDPRERIPDSGA
ncbi:hypothetical protein Tco_0287103 [Tanacetum coccineum]